MYSINDRNYERSCQFENGLTKRYCERREQKRFVFVISLVTFWVTLELIMSNKSFLHLTYILGATTGATTFWGPLPLLAMPLAKKTEI